MKIKRIGLSVLILLIGYLIYFYPIQRNMAEKAFVEYILAQGTNEENIKEKKIFKDYKQDGYRIDVVYKDDLDYKYEYKYVVGKAKEGTHYKRMRCWVYTLDYNSVQLTEHADKIKYPPIE